MRKFVVMCAGVILFATSSAIAGTWTPLDAPDAPGGGDTYVEGISGNNIVGYYKDSYDKARGFLYDGITWTTLDMPGANGTLINGIDGGNMVGRYYDATGQHGFLYDGTTWTILNKGGAENTYLTDIDGGNIVGYYENAGGYAQGLLYDGSTWTTLNMPDAAMWTEIWGISGNNLVGVYDKLVWIYDGENYYYEDRIFGFLYDGTTWTTIEKPGAIATFIKGIDEDKLVGGYADASNNQHGYFYDGSAWITLDKPGASDTYINGIDGSKLVGCYTAHGFVYEIPEPATLLLLGLGAVMVIRKR